MKRRWVVSPTYRSAIDAIKQARLDLDVGQRALAERLGMHPSYLNKIENIDRRLDILEFFEIAEALGLDPRALFDRVAKAVEATDKA